MSYYDHPTWEQEREDALWQESLPRATYDRMALNQYAAAYGEQDPGRAWISTPFDTWEPNPFYVGPPVRHPEDDRDD